MKHFILFTILFSFINVTNANNVDMESFTSINEQKRYQNLINEIRCPVCQGQSIAGSNSDLAIDLKTKVKELIDLGKTDKEIYTFMTERYGDFVIFKPPLNKATYFLWFAPFVFMLIFLIILFKATKNNNNNTNIRQENLAQAKKLLK